VLHQAAQHLDHRARRLAGADHVTVKRREGVGMRRHRVRKLLAANDAVAQVSGDLTLRRILFALIGQTVQRRAQRHAGLQQVTQLRREEQHLGGLHAQLAAAHLELPDRRALGLGLLGLGLRHGKRRMPQLLDRRQRRTAVARFQHALDLAAVFCQRFVGKIRHTSSPCQLGVRI